MAPARGADDPEVARMATCRDSWLDWQKTDPVKLQAFGAQFRSEFSRNESDPFFVPKSPLSIAGFPVTRAFPDSVGMGVGFSVFVAGTFDETRKVLEKVLGKPLEHCGVSDDMRSCELKISDMRTVMLMAEDNPKSTTTLIGCYYYYEK
jgi:hypothetical protein